MQDTPYLLGFLLSLFFLLLLVPVTLRFLSFVVIRTVIFRLQEETVSENVNLFLWPHQSHPTIPQWRLRLPQPPPLDLFSIFFLLILIVDLALSIPWDWSSTAFLFLVGLPSLACLFFLFLLLQDSEVILRATFHLNDSYQRQQQKS